MTKGYLANGLFTIGDRIVNDVVSRELRSRYKLITNEDLDLFVPQEQEINDKNAHFSSVDIAKLDSEALMASDFLVAIIDGVEVDSGVSAEIGMFATTGKPIFALYSDIRQQGRSNPDKLQALMDDSEENPFFYRNLFVIGLIKQTDGGVYNDITSLVVAVSNLFVKDSETNE